MRRKGSETASDGIRYHPLKRREGGGDIHLFIVFFTVLKGGSGVVGAAV